MKHKHYLILLFILMSMAVCSTALVSCGDDDEPLPTEQKTSQDDEEKKDEEKEEAKQPEEDPEKNTTDVAVTGRVGEVGVFYVRIGGVVNLDVISASYTKVEIGVEISTKKDFAQKMRIKATEVVGRKFSILASRIASETMFYYRTYVSVSTLSYDYYGETYSFWTLKTVDDIAITGQTEDIGLLYAKIAGKVNLSDLKPIDGSATVGVEISKDENFSSGYQYDSSTRYGGTTSTINCHFSSLVPDTKYYYRTCLSVSSFPSSCRYYGEIKSFTTKALSAPLATTGQAEAGATFAQISGKADLSEITGLKTTVGIEVSETSDFTNPKRLTTTDTSKDFSCRFIGLNLASKYYYRTFVKVDFGSEEKEYYGEIKSFMTKAISATFLTTGQAEAGFISAQISGKADLSEITGFNSTVGIEVCEGSDFSNPKRLMKTDTSKEFSCLFTGLNPASKYYYRTFVKVDFGSEEKEYYGATKTFTTKSFDNSNHYVDLGLPSGTLWATRNVGASKPEDYGLYFAWGETVPYGGTDGSNAMNYSYAGSYTKTYYDYSTYKYCNGSYTTMTKYCNDSYFGYNGFTDNLTELVPEDDAATANWGSGWCMPSFVQLSELCDKCTWTWTTFNNVSGYVVSGSNGNAIFLPAAGYRNSSSLYDAGSDGYFWSRTLDTSNPSGARYLYFYSSNIYTYNYSYNRYYGRSVRPVRVSQ